MNNQECKIRPQIITVISNEPSFYPYSVEINKCSSGCNNTNDPYSKLCAPDVVENQNLKVLNLVSTTNEKKKKNSIKLVNVNLDYIQVFVRCECKELIYKRICDKRFIWNPSDCDCECDKSCDAGEYLDYENCKCRKKLLDKLVEECSEYIDGNEIIYIDYRNV